MTAAHRRSNLGLVLAILIVPPVARAAGVSGVVRQSAGLQPPVPNARITLFTSSLSSFLETRSTASGAYSFDDVPQGTYLLGCAAIRFAYQEVAVTVASGDQQRDFFLGPETHPGQWNIAGTTEPEFLDATDIAIVLADGRVFYCHDTTDPILFDPVTGQNSFPSGSGSPQGCQNGTLLADGRFIMVGGQTPSDPGSFQNAVRWVKTWRPATGSWTQLANIQHPSGRWYPGLARLADGSLLIMGGGTAPSAARTATCERFNLATQTWTYTGSMLNPTEFPPSTLLYTGEVLATWWPPQLCNTTTGQWRATGNFMQPNRYWPGHSDHSIVVLDDGRVLAMGVVSGGSGNTRMGEIYDPATETWSLTSNPGLVRLQSEVVQLPDGRVFVGGGETEVDAPPVADVLGVVKWCDLYDPGVDAWRRVADMNWFREYHAVTVLVPDGRVLTTGGTRIKFQFGPTSGDIEAFSPPYLFRGVRPQITGLSTTMPARGCPITLTITPQTAITSVVLMGVPTTTHWVDGGINRRLVLPVQQAGDAVTAILPTDRNVLPLGHYMLFAMVDDVPSVARIVLVRSAVEGDMDCDEDVDLRDVVAFQACVVPGGAAQAGCGAADVNGDGAVDTEDFGAFALDMTGP